MENNLTGKKILVTRPKQQSESLCKMIESKGGEAIRFPVMHIKPPAETHALREILSRVADYDIGIFISQNAVNQVMKLLNKDIHALYILKLVAVGKATARSLKQAGFDEITHADSVASTETLLELPILQADLLKGSRIIIFRGVGGRELLANILAERGATVEYAEVYQRVPVHYENTVLDKIWLHERPDYTVVTSNEGLQYLFDMVNPQQKPGLLETQLVVLGSRMAELAMDLGFRKKPVIAGETSDKGLLKAIIKAAGVNE